MADSSTPISRVGYGPVYEGDDDIDDEHPRPDSPLSLLNITASTSLLPQQNSTTRSQSTGITAAARRRLKWLKAKWRRGVFFRSIFGILGDDRDGNSNRESVAITVLHSAIFHRFLQLVLILTAVITTLLFVKYADKPSDKLYGDIDFTTLEPFNVTALIENGTDAAVWDSQKGLLGLNGDKNSQKGGYSVFLEMHTHTRHSDSVLSPKQVVDWAIAYGFNAVVVSDHNTLSGGIAAQSYANEVYNIDPANPRILVIPAIEYTTCRMHLQLVGLTSPIPAPTAAFPSDEELQSIIHLTHSQGGLAIVNHLPWSLGTERGYNIPTLPQHPTREQLVEWGVDGFEILHGQVLDLPTLLFARKHNMPLISSTDLHRPEDVPYGWTLMRDTPLTIPAILEKLKKAQTGIVFHPTGVGKKVLWPEANPEWDKWAPLVGVDFGYFYEDRRGMYSFTGEFCHKRKFIMYKGRAVWFVVWVTVAWVGYEAVRWLLGLVWVKIKSRAAKKSANRMF